MTARGRRARLRAAAAGFAAAAGCLVVLAGLASAAPAAPAGGRAVAAGPFPLLALQQGRLTEGSPTPYDGLGGAVALDGDTALVGAPGETIGGQGYTGAAFVYVRAGGVWSLQAELTCPQPAAGDGFGAAVALDGDTALIGAADHSAGSAARAGAAYVFVRSGSTWSLQAELTAADARSDDWLGSSVALDGDTALIGAAGKTVGGRAYAGAAYVYARSGATWSQQAELSAADGATGDEFGDAVALWGGTALIGAPNRASAGAAQAGDAYVFSRSGADWSLLAELGAPDPTARAGFGSALALEGDTALVGAGGAGVAGQQNVGAAYVFEPSGGNWPVVAELTDPGATAGDWFGSAVALDGGRALVGAWGTTVAGELEAGAAYVYDRGAAGWAPTAVVTAGDGADGDTFGWSVAVAGDTTLAGAPGNTISGRPLAGAAYVHVLVPAPSLTLAASPAVTKAGRTVTLTGLITNLVPASSAVTVCRRQGGTLTPLKTVPLSDAGDYAASLQVKTAGTWVFVAVYKAGGQSFKSPAATVVVKKKPKPKPKPKPHHGSAAAPAH